MEYLVLVRMYRVERNNLHQQIRDERFDASWELERVELGLMQYLVYAVLRINS